MVFHARYFCMKKHLFFFDCQQQLCVFTFFYAKMTTLPVIFGNIDVIFLQIYNR